MNNSKKYCYPYLNGNPFLPSFGYKNSLAGFGQLLMTVCMFGTGPFIFHNIYFILLSLATLICLLLIMAPAMKLTCFSSLPGITYAKV